MDYQSQDRDPRRRNIAVIGSGISGLSAAWLLSQAHDVTVFEASPRIGGHSNTVEFESAGLRVAVDTGFIVYNEVTYPNLTALFRHLQVPTTPTTMSFAVSLDDGGFEYSGGTGFGLLAQKSNIVRPRFWSMMRDLVRFYRQAPRDVDVMGGLSLDAYLSAKGYGRAFREDHLYPMAAAIWSTPAAAVGDYPATNFVKFCCNHGLLELWDRPVWRTVTGGSREYVARLTNSFSDDIRVSTPVRSIRRNACGVEIITDRCGSEHFDDVVIATHADQALALLSDASDDERRILGSFHYALNEAVLHSDVSVMPKRKAAWSAWNYTGRSNKGGDAGFDRPSISYWMNRLQPLGEAPPTFVTLNPQQPIREASIICRETYEHPVFDLATEQAQRQLWSLQGRRGTWFCGAHFGSGFHEDGLQAGLAVAEDLGGVRRPWQVADESARIVRTPVVSYPIDMGVPA